MSAARPDMCVVLMTAPSADVAASIARSLVEEKLAACVNIIPAVRSIYAWQGKVCDEGEVLCILKTRRALFAVLRDRIHVLHPYDVPEVVALDPFEANDLYGKWVVESTREG